MAYACVQSLHGLDPPDQLLVEHLLGAIAQLRLLALEVVLELGDVHVIRVLTSALLGHRGSGARYEARVYAPCVAAPSRALAREKCTVIGYSMYSAIRNRIIKKTAKDLAKIS